LRRAPRAVTGAARALLLVHLLAGARVLVARLHLVGAGPALGELPVDAAREDIAADLGDAEDRVRQFDLAGLGAGEGDDVEFHQALPSPSGVSAGASTTVASEAPPAVLKAPGFGRSAGAARFTASR